ncbi:nuclear transport factor 2 family protein [Paraburkholderia caribensis]|uniref:nuclear transport factor 2 family protein n=1 Tax=Paraburkholderia caribensis TaxID=75105 RepID=UPI001D094375|nr:nuclear transport factor 2 family protein [Paraburkholderia caribensis]
MTRNFATEQIIRELDNRRYIAMVRKDFDALEVLLDDELMYVHSSGVVDTKSTYMGGIRTGHWDYQHVKRSGFESAEPVIRVVGDVALVFATLAIELIARGEKSTFKSRAFAIWMHRDGRWRLRTVHSVAMGEPAAPGIRRSRRKTRV